jgi:hypothetical protein
LGTIAVVSDDFEAPHPNGAVVVGEPESPEQRRARRTRRRIFLAIAVVVAIVWAYAIWFSVTQGSPEDLDEDARAAVAGVCAEALSELVALPDFTEASTAQDNVELVRRENAIFDAMVTDIDAVEPVNPDSADALDEWLEDWRDLVAARAEFADDLATDGTARLRTPAVSSGALEPVTERMNGYAIQRGVAMCQPDTLQAEMVDGPRNYAAGADA